MTLSTRISRIYLIVAAATLVLGFALYWIMSSAHDHQAVADARTKLEAVAESQTPLLTQEFVNDRFYAAVIRGKSIFEDQRQDGVEVGLYRPGGSALFESRDISSILQSWRRGEQVSSFDGKTYVLLEKK